MKEDNTKWNMEHTNIAKTRKDGGNSGRNEEVQARDTSTPRKNIGRQKNHRQKEYTLLYSGESMQSRSNKWQTGKHNNRKYTKRHQ